MGRLVRLVTTGVWGLALVAAWPGGEPARATAVSVSLQSFATGLSSPTTIANTGVAGDTRLFVTERSGTIRVVQSNGTVGSTPFLDITSRVVSGGEQGLLGLAFHPRYSSNRYFYVYYTNLSGNIVLSRFQTTSGDPNVADPNSEQVVLTIAHPGATNHNGGELQFGPDGYLYVGVGDGGGANDVPGNSQNKNVLLGKVLRLNLDGDGFPSDPLKNYAIPPSNPLVGKAGAPEIWDWGVRNPWRFSFDRATHDLFIADVGQGAREEVDIEPFGTGGRNYGWHCREGLIANPANPSDCAGFSGYMDPAMDYDHSTGNCAITGGYVYRGSAQPDLGGYYFMADYCSGEVFTLYNHGVGGWEKQYQATLSGHSISTFGEDIAGELYVADLANGTIYKLMGTNPSVQVYRLANPTTHERLVTANPAERDQAVMKYGYHYEGFAFLGARGSTPTAYPVYRLVNPSTHERLFTMSSAERDAAVAQYGFVSEGVAFNGVAQSQAGALAIHRLANPTTHERLFTASSAEASAAVSQYGYVDEGIGWYAPGQ